MAGGQDVPSISGVARGCHRRHEALQPDALFIGRGLLWLSLRAQPPQRAGDGGPAGGHALLGRQPSHQHASRTKTVLLFSHVCTCIVE